MPIDGPGRGVEQAGGGNKLGNKVGEMRPEEHSTQGFGRLEAPAGRAARKRKRAGGVPAWAACPLGPGAVRSPGNPEEAEPWKPREEGLVSCHLVAWGD